MLISEKVTYTLTSVVFEGPAYKEVSGLSRLSTRKREKF